MTFFSVFWGGLLPITNEGLLLNLKMLNSTSNYIL